MADSALQVDQIASAIVVADGRELRFDDAPTSLWSGLWLNRPGLFPST